VVAGTARGRPLVAPGEGTRPLGDRVKQTLFAILEPAIRGRAFLDLYAGSGAAGIEALSRGASSAVFVEKDPSALAAIEQNLTATGFGRDKADIVRGQVGKWLDGRAAGSQQREPFAAVIADPPYDKPAELDSTLRRIDAAGPGGVLAPDGVVVAKHFWKTPPAAEIGLLRSVRERRFGETTLTFYRWADEEDG
jgi:16S rRNA (guanine966-N2)-methyltransferase